MRVRGFAENARACLDLLSDGVERGDGQRAVKKQPAEPMDGSQNHGHTNQPMIL